MALALPIASQLHASAGITALGVMLTGQSLGTPLARSTFDQMSHLHQQLLVWGGGGLGYQLGAWEGGERQFGGGSEFACSST